MESTQIDKLRQATRRRLAMEVRKTLTGIREGITAPLASMAYFYALFEDHFTRQTEHAHRLKKIGTLCLQVPEEFILAVGAEPLRLCSGSYAYDQVGSDFLPARSCALIKSTLGLLRLQEKDTQPDLIVIPATCDQKRKTGILLEEQALKIYMLELPARKDTANARQYWQNSIQELIVELQKVTGKKITRKSLRRAMEITRSAREEFRRFSRFRKCQPALISGRESFLVSNAYMIDQPESWTRALHHLNNELDHRLASGTTVEKGTTARILFTGSPPVFPNLKLPIMIEETGAVIVADEVCSSNRLLHDVPMYDESNLYDMIPAVADRYLKPCTCPCFVPNTNRKRRIAEMVNTYQISGVVYQAFSGCHLYEMEQKSMQKHLSEMNIPMLYIETDYSPEDAGQISTRVEAFVESIAVKSRRN
ncbi:2-hydroxyacyl-CoA dehydratase family protein [bacterium]|nr:2-hydroxyacyl-CoA dehydratase family protein [bacterium]